VRGELRRNKCSSDGGGGSAPFALSSVLYAVFFLLFF
jgi:hypothetical protein